jgi:hypothetical protein
MEGPFFSMPWDAFAAKVGSEIGVSPWFPIVQVAALDAGPASPRCSDEFRPKFVARLRRIGDPIDELTPGIPIDRPCFRPSRRGP